MGNVRDGLNRNLPFFVHDYGYVNIAAADFDPITTETDWRGALNISQVGSYRKNGFLARPNADGNFYAVTWDQYHRAMHNPHGLTEVQIIATIVPQLFNGVENQWIECLLIKVFAHGPGQNGGQHDTICTDINVGLLL